MFVGDCSSELAEIKFAKLEKECRPEDFTYPNCEDLDGYSFQVKQSCLLEFPEEPNEGFFIRQSIFYSDSDCSFIANKDRS